MVVRSVGFSQAGSGGAPESSENRSLREYCEAINARNEEAMARFVRESRPRVFSFLLSMLLNREDAEDVTQETLLKAVENIGQFNGQASLSTWVLKIARNSAIDFKRKVQRQRSSIRNLADTDESDNWVCIEKSSRSDSPDSALFLREKLGKISQLMSSLSDEHREVLILREVDGLSYDEIAEVAQVSRGTVMSRLFYARKRIQVALSEHQGVSDTLAEAGQQKWVG